MVRVCQNVWRGAKGLYVLIGVNKRAIWRGPYSDLKSAELARDALAEQRNPRPGITVSYVKDARSIRRKPWRLRVRTGKRERRHIGYYATWDEAWEVAKVWRA